MSRGASYSRTAALVALGAFAVHQLHFLLSAGSGAGEDLRREGYTFLGHVPVTLGALAVTVIAARLLIAYFATPKLSPMRPGASLRHPALVAVAVFGVYLAQEGLEAVFFARHAEGVLAALANGLWLALLLSAFLGPLFFALDSWLGRLEHLVASIADPPSYGSASRDSEKPHYVLRPASALSPLAFGLARRPPPPALSSR